MSDPRIAIVVTYFGRLPVWMPAFLRSCETNERVHWLIYTDTDAVPAPPNVYFKALDLAGFNARASDAIGASIRIEPVSLRKVCDFKPVYGLMFADDLRGFDWWSCSDLDVIWGDIRRFVTDELLAAYNIISSRQHKVSGHFTLWRNTEEINRTYTIIPDAAAKLAVPQYLRLDENVLTERLREQLARMSMKTRPRVYWTEEMTIPAAYQKALLASDADWRLIWRDGRVFDAEGRELMYLHFHKLKQQLTSVDFAAEERPGAFALTRHGIVSRFEGLVSEEDTFQRGREELDGGS